MILAGPWLVRRFLEGRAHPRTLMWTYLTGLVAAVGATLVLLVALFLRYLPHGMLWEAGLACAMDDGCATALPPWAGAGFSFLIGGVVLGLVSFTVLALGSQMGCSGRRCKELMQASRPFEGRMPGSLRGRVLLVVDDALRSYTIGFFRPWVVISTGLRDALDDDELFAVLAHEEGHLLRRDNLVILVGQTISLAFAMVPGVRVCYASLRRCQELAADLFARERTGDGLVVASSLHKFARSVASPVVRPTQVAVGFADEGNVGERIRGLLVDELVVTSRRRFAVAVAALAIVLAGFTGSAAAFTQVTFASSTDCAACHPSGESLTQPATGLGVCSSQIG